MPVDLSLATAFIDLKPRGGNALDSALREYKSKITALESSTKTWMNLMGGAGRKQAYDSVLSGIRKETDTMVSAARGVAAARRIFQTPEGRQAFGQNSLARLQQEAGQKRFRADEIRAQSQFMQTPEGRRATLEHVRASRDVQASMKEFRRAQLIVEHGQIVGRLKGAKEELQGGGMTAAKAGAMTAATGFGLLQDLKSGQALYGWFRVLAATIGRDLTPAIMSVIRVLRFITDSYNSVPKPVRDTAGSAAVYGGLAYGGYRAGRAGLAASQALLGGLGIGGGTAAGLASAASAAQATRMFGGGAAGAAATTATWAGRAARLGRATGVGFLLGAGIETIVGHARKGQRNTDAAANDAASSGIASGGLASDEVQAHPLYQRLAGIQDAAKREQTRKRYQSQLESRLASVEAERGETEAGIAGAERMPRWNAISRSGVTSRQLLTLGFGGENRYDARSRLSSEAKDLQAALAVLRQTAEQGRVAPGSASGQAGAAGNNLLGKPPGPPASYMAFEDVRKNAMLAAVNIEPWERELVSINQQMFREAQGSNANLQHMTEAFDRLADRLGLRD